MGCGDAGRVCSSCYAELIQKCLLKTIPHHPPPLILCWEKTWSITSYLIQELGHPEVLDLGRWFLDLKQRLTLNLDSVRENWNNMWLGVIVGAQCLFCFIAISGIHTKPSLLTPKLGRAERGSKNRMNEWMNKYPNKWSFYQCLSWIDLLKSFHT